MAIKPILSDLLVAGLPLQTATDNPTNLVWFDVDGNLLNVDKDSATGTEYYDTDSDFPATGEEWKLYVDKENRQVYIWYPVAEEYNSLGYEYCTISDGSGNHHNLTNLEWISFLAGGTLRTSLSWSQMNIGFDLTSATDGQVPTVNGGWVIWSDVPAGFDKFGIVDDDSNEADIHNLDTILFQSWKGIKTTVYPNGTVETNIDIDGATGGQVLSYDGTDIVWITPGSTVATRYATTITPVVNVAQTVTHNLNSTDVIVQVRDVATNEVVEVSVVIVNANSITVTSSTTDQLRVIVL